MHRYVTGASALVILAALAAGPTTVLAQESTKLCNVIVDGDGDPVRGSEADYVAHSNSNACADGDQVEGVDAAAQPAVVNAAPAAPAKVDPLVVYFDVNQDRLDAGARAEVSAYVGELMATSPKGLTVVGYTDTSGSPARNAELSESRANSVAAALIEAGVPASMITRRASGEDAVAVATPDGTREASNRRVTITPAY
jgi:outer membrane protein OmpA-like peptidoglycan-associated protein